jgi:hypothetical protein
MIFEVFPAFKEDGSVLQLADILSAIPENDWIWAILDFYGVGAVPNKLPIEDFENRVRSAPQGILMPWSELKKFANSLHQTYDCLIIAAKSSQDISSDKSVKENFSKCEVVVEAFDCTEWSVWARDKDLMRQLTKLRTLLVH